jgi:hypothetical protein
MNSCMSMDGMARTAQRDCGGPSLDGAARGTTSLPRVVGRAPWLAAWALVGILGTVAHGQLACEPYQGTTPPCSHSFGAPGGGPPEGPAPLFGSRCWYTLCSSMFNGPPSTGFPLNLSMGFGPAMGDYPPMTLDAAASTSPVVAREGGYHARAVPAATRPMLSGVVDMITGAPLLQETDFELTYGTAVFRHIRTYAETASTFRHEHTCTQGNWSGVQSEAKAPNHYWDWTGQG